MHTAMTRRFLLASLALAGTAFAQETKPLRAGIIGLDTSHAVAFITTLNTKKPPQTAGVTVVAAYPKGSPDIESSTKRVPEYTEKARAAGVEIVDSIDALLAKVDVVFLETNDGRPHLEQLRPCLTAKKPVFIDKPVAASLKDAIAIYAEAKKAGVPVFCSSSLRFGKNTQAVAKGEYGKVLHAETFSPVNLEATHPDLYWYGVHGCESLYTVMGTGCLSVKREMIEDGKVQVTGTWPNGRTGIFRQENGKDRKSYGGKAVTEKGDVEIGKYEGYDVLLYAIIDCFRTGKVPVSAEETVELYAFMEAADESKRRAGAEVTIKEVMEKASK